MSTALAFSSPTSLADALAALASGARPVAGGTDLVVGARQGKAPIPDQLVAIDRIAELRHATTSPTGLSLGALTCHEQIASDAVIIEHFTALADASAIVGSHATRAHGTIGGNVMTASPAMDAGGPLVCLGATVTLQSVNASRTLPIEELFIGPGRTVAASDELLVRIDVPAPTPGTGSCYVRLEYRRQMEIAIVGATAVVTMVGGKITDARLAMTSLAPTIRRATEAEAALVGTAGTTADVDRAAAAFAAACSPISDVRASAPYRNAMAAVMCRRAIVGAMARAKGESVAVPASTTMRGVR
jgi:CO/xanthine dehydrogenase FAD-binding subunit